jgi:hypothetical protein
MEAWVEVEAGILFDKWGPSHGSMERVVGQHAKKIPATYVFALNPPVRVCVKTRGIDRSLTVAAQYVDDSAMAATEPRA